MSSLQKLVYNNYMGAFPKTQQVKNLPTMQETQESQDRSMGDPVGQEMATHSTILTQKTPWTEEPGRLHQNGCKELDMIEHEHG